LIAFNGIIGKQLPTMTIKLPQKSILDRFLESIGKKRAVKIPENVYEKFGPYVYAKAQKESFWRALLRPKDAELPEGYTYPKHNEND
jgi:hypothetical protein